MADYSDFARCCLAANTTRVFAQGGARQQAGLLLGLPLRASRSLPELAGDHKQPGTIWNGVRGAGVYDVVLGRGGAVTELDA